MITQKYLDDLTYKITACAIEVHRQLGPGLLESVYEKCFARELAIQNIPFTKQQLIPVIYKGIEVDAELRFDILVEDLIAVELKAVDALAPIFEAQVLTYMKLLQKPKGILFNFNCLNIIKEGRKTLVNDLYASLPKS
jgi:GxxExxY protein